LLASAHWRQKRYLVPGSQRSAPTGILLVYGGRDRSPKGRELRKAAAVALEKVLDASALGKLGFVVIDTGDVLELPEEKNADSHTGHSSVYKPQQKAAQPREVSFAQTSRLKYNPPTDRVSACSETGKHSERIGGLRIMKILLVSLA
jgi:hypothetical protein